MVVPGALKRRAVPSVLRKWVPDQSLVVVVTVPRALSMVPVKADPLPEKVRVPPSVWRRVPAPRRAPDAWPVATDPQVR